MEKKLILRGLLAGAVGGLLAFVFARIFAEPLIDRAIAYEEGRGAAEAALHAAASLSGGAGHVMDEGDPIVSRGVQSGVGIGIGMVAFGLVIGGLYAVAYALCLGRTGRIRPKPLALAVAAAGFVVVYLVPFLKYPANPPAVGNDETVSQRTGLYLTMLVVSLVAGVLATAFGQGLRARLGTWNATIVACGGFAVVVGIAMAVLPNLGHLSANVAENGRRATETPLPLRDAEGNIAFPGFPADVLAEFRLYAIGAQLILWTAIGLVFAPMAERVLQGGSEAAPVRPARPVRAG